MNLSNRSMTMNITKNIDLLDKFILIWVQRDENIIYIDKN